CREQSSRSCLAFERNTSACQGSGTMPTRCAISTASRGVADLLRSITRRAASVSSGFNEPPGFVDNVSFINAVCLCKFTPIHQARVEVNCLARFAFGAVANLSNGLHITFQRFVNQRLRDGFGECRLRSIFQHLSQLRGQGVGQFGALWST